MAARHWSATLGLVAAALAMGLILMRWRETGAPVPTPLRLANTGASVVVVAEVHIVGTQPPQGLKGPWRLEAAPRPPAPKALAGSAAAAAAVPAAIPAAVPAAASAAASTATSAASISVPMVQAGVLALAPGRPVELAVQLLAPLALRQTCTLAPRPPGQCQLSVAVSARETGRSASSSVACSFEC